MRDHGIIITLEGLVLVAQVAHSSRLDGLPGLEVAVEALRFARARKKISNREILRTAELLRQAKVMGPYLEAVQ